MKVEDGIPIPPKRGQRGERGRIVGAMQIGQSVLCESEPEAQRVRDACRHCGFKCAQRKVSGGWRVWRTG